MPKPAATKKLWAGTPELSSRRPRRSSFLPSPTVLPLPRKPENRLTRASGRKPTGLGGEVRRGGPGQLWSPPSTEFGHKGPERPHRAGLADLVWSLVRDGLSGSNPPEGSWWADSLSRGHQQVASRLLLGHSRAGYLQKRWDGHPSSVSPSPLPPLAVRAGVRGDRR